MEKYQSYKPSGVEWIGMIPSNWEIRRIKYLFRSIVEKSVDGSEELLSVSEKKGIVPRRELRDENEELTRSESLEGYLKVEKDDLVNNIMLMWKRGLGFSNYKGIVSPSYSVFRLNEPNLPSYWNYLLRTDLYITEYRKNSTGVIESRLRLYDDSFGDIYSILPPLSEQHQIVQFLDSKTELIDKLISTKERKITLLKEQRTSLINQVVTKGLNPNVKMKDSGFEWIEEIPEHWELKPLKYLIKNLNSGVSVNSENVPVKDEIELGVLKTSCVYGDVFRPEENKKVVIEEIGRVNCPVFKDTIIISRMNTPELVGSSGYVHQNYSNLFLPDRLWITEFKKEVDISVKFYSYILKSDRYKKTLSSKSTGTSSSMKNISKNDLLSLPVPYFDLKEQLELTIYLDEYSKKSDDLIQLEQKKIDLLKEYRQSLISEVVTGKIKVTTDE